MDYLNQITKLTEEIMRCITPSLGYSTHYSDEFMTDPMCFYKLLHYPPQADNAHALQRGILMDSTSFFFSRRLLSSRPCSLHAEHAHMSRKGIGAHHGFGVITLLLQGDVPGLEVW